MRHSLRSTSIHSLCSTPSQASVGTFEGSSVLTRSTFNKTAPTQLTLHTHARIVCLTLLSFYSSQQYLKPGEGPIVLVLAPTRERESISRRKHPTQFVVNSTRSIICLQLPSRSRKSATNLAPRPTSKIPLYTVECPSRGRFGTCGLALRSSSLRLDVSSTTSNKVTPTSSG